MKRSIIIGTGRFIPENIYPNAFFHNHEFFDVNGSAIEGSSEEITSKFESITGIAERRYVRPEENASDIAILAANQAIENAGLNREQIGQIIFAHNFGDVSNGSVQTDILPALASRVKSKLGINNPACVAYDLIYGCPGWLQGLIVADAMAKAGHLRYSLVIGGEALSRVVDPSDRDGMIFADGAGAAILDFQEPEQEKGILASSMLSHTREEAYYLYMDQSNDPSRRDGTKYIKMHGRKVYEYALKHVPDAMKDCLDKSGHDISDVRKIFIHQANEKLDMTVIKRFYRLFGIREIPEDMTPMTVQFLGNSSVATIPTMLDMVLRGDMPAHKIEAGDLVLFASVGAGMNINAIAYRF